jgi:hypothetical protein
MFAIARDGRFGESHSDTRTPHTAALHQVSPPPNRRCGNTQVAPPCDELSQRPPIFSLEIVITADNTFAYSSDLSKFEPTLRAVFDAAIDSVQAIPQVCAAPPLSAIF